VLTWLDWDTHGIGSAADNIYGGLYDPDRDSAVQVDGLLALLGEADRTAVGSSSKLVSEKSVDVVRLGYSRFTNAQAWSL
jgi:hypothetical protein